MELFGTHSSLLESLLPGPLFQGLPPQRVYGVLKALGTPLMALLLTRHSGQKDDDIHPVKMAFRYCVRSTVTCNMHMLSLLRLPNYIYWFRICRLWNPLCGPS
ncbi:hypothetical protein BDFG_07044 [Blastomyces dermatitidis ATCC 26199]|nr:hypothetical protein BDFG_07044 [Blastomyces dermatitidis ATCC 26199]